MPPKARFTREEIVEAAYEILRTEGDDALTARELAKRLGTSPRPLFTVFSSMDEIKSLSVERARAEYAEYQESGLGRENAFRGSGEGYIAFAQKEPKLFQLLFMREAESIPSLDNVLCGIDEYYERIVKCVREQYGLSEDDAKNVYQHSWIYSHGIATLIATGVCRFSEEEITEMLNTVCGSVIRKFITESKN